MSETKFTPGPWEVHKRLDIYAGTVATTVAHCYDRIRDESKFNAALISAAPELLKSLEEARELFEMIGKFTGGELTRVTIWREKAEKALKKAVGEAS